MANNLYKSLGKQNMMLPGPLGNMQTFMQKFNQFRQSFQGNPQQQVQQLLNSGKMTQDQFNQLRNIAQQIQGMMNK